MVDLALYRARIGGFGDGHGHLQKRGGDPYRKRRLSTMGEWLVCMVVGVSWVAVMCFCLQVNNDMKGFHMPNRRETCKVGGSYRVSGNEKMPLWHCREHDIGKNFLEKGMNEKLEARIFSRKVTTNKGMWSIQLSWEDSALVDSVEEKMLEGLTIDELRRYNPNDEIVLNSEVQRDSCDFCGVVGLYNKTKWRDSGIKTRLVLELDRLNQKEIDTQEAELGEKIVLWSFLEMDGWDAVDTCERTLSCVGEVKLWADLSYDEGSVDERRWGLLIVRSGWVLEAKTAVKLKRVNSKYERSRLWVSGDIHPNPGPVSPVEVASEKEIVNDPVVLSDEMKTQDTPNSATVNNPNISLQVKRELLTYEMSTVDQLESGYGVNQGSPADSPFIDQASQLRVAGKPVDEWTTSHQEVTEGAVGQSTGSASTQDKHQMKSAGTLGAEYLKELEGFLQPRAENTHTGQGPTVGLKSPEDRRLLGEAGEGDGGTHNTSASSLPLSQGSGGCVASSEVEHPQDDTKGVQQHHQGNTASPEAEKEPKQPQMMEGGSQHEPSTSSAPVVGATASAATSATTDPIHQQFQGSNSLVPSPGTEVDGALELQRGTQHLHDPPLGGGGTGNDINMRRDTAPGTAEGDVVPALGAKTTNQDPAESSGVGGLPIPYEGEGNPNPNPDNNGPGQPLDSAMKWGGARPKQNLFYSKTNGAKSANVVQLSVNAGQQSQFLKADNDLSVKSVLLDGPTRAHSDHMSAKTTSCGDIPGGVVYDLSDVVSDDAAKVQNKVRVLPDLSPNPCSAQSKEGRGREGYRGGGAEEGVGEGVVVLDTQEKEEGSQMSIQDQLSMLTSAFLKFTSQLQQNKVQAQEDSDRKHQQITSTQEQLTCMQQQAKLEFQRTHEEIKEIKTHMHQSREALGEVKKVMTEVKTTVQNNEEAIKNVQQEQRNMQAEHKESGEKIGRLQEQVDRLEAHTRRQNFIIHGVPEIGRGGGEGKDRRSGSRYFAAAHARWGVS